MASGHFRSSSCLGSAIMSPGPEEDNSCLYCLRVLIRINSEDHVKPSVVYISVLDYSTSFTQNAAWTRQVNPVLGPSARAPSGYSRTRPLKHRKRDKRRHLCSHVLIKWVKRGDEEPF